MNILIVDDKPDRYSDFVSKIVPSVLRAEDIRFAGNLRDALEMLKSTVFGIAIVDMLLPSTPWGQPSDDGGAELLAYLSEDDDLLKPKYIIGITAADQLPKKVSEIFSVQPWQLLRTGGGGNPWEVKLENLVRHAIEIERNQSLVSYGTDFCILTALRTPEFEALSQVGFRLDDPIQVDTATYAHHGTLESGKHTIRIVAACCLRMGSVESALLTAKMIERFRPRVVALAGICAGFEEKVQYGDVIVANPCWDYTSSKISARDDGSKVVTYSPDYIDVDNEIVARLDVLKQDSQFFQQVHSKWVGEKMRAAPSLHIAPSATGPAVVADGTVLEKIRREQHRATIGLEMEAYGMYSAARMASRPRPAVFSAKAVCDYGTMFKDDKYQKYASFTSASVVFEFIKRFGGELCSIIK